MANDSQVRVDYNTLEPPSQEIQNHDRFDMNWYVLQYVLTEEFRLQLRGANEGRDGIEGSSTHGALKGLEERAIEAGATSVDSFLKKTLNSDAYDKFTEAYSNIGKLERLDKALEPKEAGPSDHTKIIQEFIRDHGAAYGLTEAQRQIGSGEGAELFQPDKLFGKATATAAMLIENASEAPEGVPKAAVLAYKKALVNLLDTNPQAKKVYDHVVARAEAEVDTTEAPSSDGAGAETAAVEEPGANVKVAVTGDEAAAEVVVDVTPPGAEAPVVLASASADDAAGVQTAEVHADGVYNPSGSADGQPSVAEEYVDAKAPVASVVLTNYPVDNGIVEQFSDVKGSAADRVPSPGVVTVTVAQFDEIQKNVEAGMATSAEKALYEEGFAKARDEHPTAKALEAAENAYDAYVRTSSADRRAGYAQQAAELKEQLDNFTVSVNGSDPVPIDQVPVTIELRNGDTLTMTEAQFEDMGVGRRRGGRGGVRLESDDRTAEIRDKMPSALDAMKAQTGYTALKAEHKEALIMSQPGISSGRVFARESADLLAGVNRLRDDLDNTEITFDVPSVVTAEQAARVISDPQHGIGGTFTAAAPEAPAVQPAATKPLADPSNKTPGTDVTPKGDNMLDASIDVPSAVDGTGMALNTTTRVPGMGGNMIS